MSNNFGLKDEIRAFWGMRAESFDASIGHGVRTDDEFRAWRGVFATLLGDLTDSRVLDVACGTGEMVRVLLSMGADVTGLDLTEPMLDRAKAKLSDGKSRARFFQGDAESTMEADDSYDAVTCRHLVWTLVDPLSAFRDWFRILKPGGTLVIVDGDWNRLSLIRKARRSLANIADRLSGSVDEHSKPSPAHDSILTRVYFKGGVPLDRLKEMLMDVGFVKIRLASLSEVERMQRKGAASFGEWLKVGMFDCFALGVQKPSA